MRGLLGLSLIAPKHLPVIKRSAMSNLLWAAFATAQSKIPPKFFWKHTYNFLAKEQPHAFTLMNYGYATSESDDASGEALPQRLYHYVASAADLTGKNILEVGAGRGGGLAHVKQRLSPKLAFGVDLSPQAVTLSRKSFGQIPGLTFLQGDAESLPFGDQSFDAVLNVESSHCYPNRAQFFQEVRRVLVSGGHFLYTDFFDPQMVKEVRSLLEKAPFQLLEEEDLTENILLALRLDEARKLALIKQTPSWIQPSFHNFAATTQSSNYKILARRERLYVRFALQK
jgi:ubiquinone/menaquinone biosynthesis C-methylase UbiE